LSISIQNKNFASFLGSKAVGAVLVDMAMWGNHGDLLSKR
jgi:hypothetical protein